MGKPVVLLVEANREASQAVVAVLEDQYDVVPVYSGKDAVSIYSSLSMKVSVVLIHSEPDDMGTQELVREMKLFNTLPEILVFAHSDHIADAITIMKEGAFDYILRPCSDALLRQTILRAYQSSTAIEKLDSLARKVILEDIDEEKWSQFLTAIRSYRRQEGQIITIDDILSHFPTFKGIDSDRLEDEWCQKAEQEFVKRFLGQSMLKVLVIEDEQGFRDILRGFLSGKYELYEAEDGAKAEALLDVIPDLDLILLDIHLPDARGDELLPLIKQKAPTADVIVITAYQEVDVAVSALRQGAVDYLNKPFLRDDLLHTMANVSQRHYVNVILPRLGRNVLQVDQKMKMRLLTDFCKQRLEQKKNIFMKDLILFFPELKQTSIPPEFCLPEKIVKSGVEEFVMDLMGQST